MPDDSLPLTVDVDDGRLWTLRAGEVGPPGVVGSGVYVPVEGGRVAAVDAGGGRILWCSDPLGGPVPAEAVGADGVVVIPLREAGPPGGFTALDRASGSVRWTLRDRDPRTAVLGAGAVVLLWSHSAKAGSVLAAVDARSGERLWERAFRHLWGVLVRGDRVIVGADAPRALDTRTGDGLWRGAYGQLLDPEGPVDQAVFHVWEQGELSVRASDTGEELSRVRFPEGALRRVHGSPELVDGGGILFEDVLRARIRLFARDGSGRAAGPLLDVSLSPWRRVLLQRTAVGADGWVYAVTRSRPPGRRVLGHPVLHAVRAGARGRPPRQTVRGPDGRSLMPWDLAAGAEYLFAGDGREIAAVRDGRVVWRGGDGEVGAPVPLGADRVLFLASGGGRHRLYCADAATGRTAS
ncbi:PQQ-binding-like beta-propeller repeat protein [Streptomyces sp. NPDC004610]|uniref:outer membrane protein assembly factor BamB family protein n=1 Tax=unclassified Streptomyces TaxID=2593676 RepID=UPI0033BC27F9